jgi:hypothetical protein
MDIIQSGVYLKTIRDWESVLFEMLFRILAEEIENLEKILQAKAVAQAVVAGSTSIDDQVKKIGRGLCFEDTSTPPGATHVSLTK